MGLPTASEFQTQDMSFHVNGATWHSATGGRLASVSPATPVRLPACAPTPEAVLGRCSLSAGFVGFPTWSHGVQGVACAVGSVQPVVPQVLRMLSPRHVAPVTATMAGHHQGPVTQTAKSSAIPGLPDDSHWAANSKCPFLPGDLHWRACQSPGTGSKTASLRPGSPCGQPAALVSPSTRARGVPACELGGLQSPGPSST